MNRIANTKIVLVALMLSTAAASAAYAQADTAPVVPDHPRVNEVNGRLSNQQQRIQAGEAKGQINAAQAARDEKHDANIAQRESVDEAKNGGHLTKAEQNRLNRAENRNSARIKQQRQ